MSVYMYVCICVKDSKKDRICESIHVFTYFFKYAHACVHILADTHFSLLPIFIKCVIQKKNNA